MTDIVFLTISILIFNVIAILTVKRMTKIEIYSTCLFVLVLELVVDIILDLKYDLYGYFAKGIDLKTFLIIFGIYPSFNVIFLNFYPFNKDIVRKVLYILIASIFCIAYEWLSVKSGYFYYRSWKLWYSAVCYPILLSTIVWNFSITKNLLRNETK